MASSVFDTSEEKTNGTRLARLLVDGGTDVLRKFLHSTHPPDKLETVLKNNEPKLRNLKLFDDQWKTLFPSTGDPPDSNTFDIALLHLLIRELCDLDPPMTEWHKMPAEDDDSIQANITRIKCFRNELCHSASTGIPSGEFEIKWNKISSALEAIEVEVYRRKIRVLKDDPIDHDTRQAVTEQVKYWQRLEEQERDQVTNEVCSYLPDKLPNERMFGRSQELEQVKNHIESRQFAVVLITGTPGFGKTTVAKAVAHELAKLENGKAVLYCSLLAKKSLTEVTTEMLYRCCNSQTQLQENQDQLLKDWSKRIKNQVIFVLDNVDGVLDSEDGDSFLSTLREMRTLSNQKLAFVMTSRKAFNYPDLPSTDVKIKPLPPEEAKKVLFSRLNDDDIPPEQLSKTDKIVELCGCVPLALSIVGSLLSDYTEEELIKHLEQEPMAILKDDGESFQTAIKASFDLLLKAKQDALVRLSIFPGSFDCDAAEAVLREALEPGTLLISTLRSLKNRSFIERVGFRRYQLHPLIRAFAKTIGQQNDDQFLLNGKTLACAHFMSRLDDNSTRYWGKDTCKRSIEYFTQDRHNFERFLQVYVDGMEDQDQNIMENCQTFLDDLPQKCMYLEKCLQPKFYIQVLERLLNSFKPETQVVHMVELLCILGHEMRKVDKEKYCKYMKKANELYLENKADFNTSVLSEVIYLHSRARYLEETVVPNGPEPKQLYGAAVKICEEKLADHPQTAAALLFAARSAKRRKENQDDDDDDEINDDDDDDDDEASLQFVKAYELFKEQLGDHFMTALCLKEFADFIFFADKTDDRLDKALRYYKMAMEMMEKLGTQDHKENIKTLKNYGICYGQKGNFVEAKRLLQRAERVAENELAEDHTSKVMIKTSLGILYHDVVAKEQTIEAWTKDQLLEEMETSMKDGLDMHYRIRGFRTMNGLDNKRLVRQVLIHYPERFPDKQYPCQ